MGRGGGDATDVVIDVGGGGPGPIPCGGGGGMMTVFAVDVGYFSIPGGMAEFSV